MMIMDHLFIDLCGTFGLSDDAVHECILRDLEKIKIHALLVFLAVVSVVIPVT